MNGIHVIHENPEWTAPLVEALVERGAPFEDWNLGLTGAGGRSIDLSRPPAPGVYYNRMSASAHTRGNRFAPEATHAVLSWLDHWGAVVVNPLSAVRLEVSKVEQYAVLKAAGIDVPRTISAFSKTAALEAATGFHGPFITKHNRAGKGLGVRLFQDADELKAHLASDDYEPPVDGVLLLQQYIRAPEPFITRVEFIGRELVYAVRVDTSDGFELCPADLCATPRPADRPKFQIIDGFDDPIAGKFRAVMHKHRIDVAGFEFIVDEDGRPYAYDINTNTNYNAEAEAKAGVSAMRVLAGYLAGRLEVAKAA
jgi:glutathione synthase/RimK-type ligase-like ATP-grasp enzyme